MSLRSISKLVLQEAQMNTNFCRLLYEGLLKRSPELGALEYWAMMIKSGWSHEKVLAAFLDSNEFKERNKGSEFLFVPPGHFYSPIVDTNF
jgi:hypothetical protein